MSKSKQSYSRPEHLFEFKHLLDIIDLLLPRAISAGLSVLPSHGGKFGEDRRWRSELEIPGDFLRFPTLHFLLFLLSPSPVEPFPNNPGEDLPSALVSLGQLKRFEGNSSECRVRACFTFAVS